jgi:hypothetical protein
VRNQSIDVLGIRSSDAGGVALVALVGTDDFAYPSCRPGDTAAWVLVLLFNLGNVWRNLLLWWHDLFAARQCVSRAWLVINRWIAAALA